MIVVDDAPEVVAYVERALGIALSEPRRAIGFVSNEGRPLAAFVFNGFCIPNVDITVVAEPAGLTRGVIRYVSRYVFGKLECKRATIRTKKKNRRAVKMAPRFGWRFECVMKDYFPDDDAIQFRMLKAECRWLGP